MKGKKMQLRCRARVVATLFVATLVWTISPTTSRANPELTEQGLPTVIVIQPEQRDLTQEILLAGSLEPYEKASLHAKVTGYLEEIWVDIGDSVHEGEALAQLSIPEMKPELQRAEAEVPAARARLQKARAEGELARLTHKRLAELRLSEAGAVTQQDVDVAAATEKVAAAEVALARAEVLSAEARVAELESLGTYATIRAPFDGMVVARFADKGALIAAGGNGNGPIVEVMRSDRLRLALDLPESLVSHCQTGLKLSYKLDALPGQSFTAEVSRFAGALNRETRSMRIEADIENSAGKFYPGMYARVSINLGELPGATVLPSSVLRGGGASPYVFAVQEGTVQRIDVTILKDNGVEVVVGGDLEVGTQIVLSSPAQLKVGQPVHVRHHEEL